MGLSGELDGGVGRHPDLFWVEPAAVALEPLPMTSAEIHLGSKGGHLRKQLCFPRERFRWLVLRTARRRT